MEWVVFHQTYPSQAISRYEDNKPIKTQVAPNLSDLEKNLDVPFSTNNRQNSSEAVNILKPTISSDMEAMKETYRKTYKIGKMK